VLASNPVYENLLDGDQLFDRDDAAALATVKPLGDEIRQLEASGALPSTLVARSERHKRTR